MVQRSIEFGNGQKRRPRFFDFGIGKTERDVFTDQVVQGQKMIELVETPDPGFLFMNGWGTEISHKIQQVAIGDFRQCGYSQGFGKGTEFTQTRGQGLNGSGWKIGNFTIIDKTGKLLFEHRETSFWED